MTTELQAEEDDTLGCLDGFWHLEGLHGHLWLTGVCRSMAASPAVKLVHAPAPRVLHTLQVQHTGAAYRMLVAAFDHRIVISQILIPLPVAGRWV